MTIEDRSLLFDIMREKNNIYWRVMDGNTELFSYDDIFDVEKSISKLNKVLDSSGAGYCKIVLSTKSKAEKGAGGSIKDCNSTYSVKCGREAQGINGASSGNNMQYIQQIDELKREIIEIKNLHSRKELVDRIEALESEEDEEPEGIGAVMTQQLLPHLPALISKILGIDISAPVTSLAGHEEHQITIEDAVTETHEPTNLDAQKKLCARACGIMLSVDKNAGTHLMMLSQLAKDKPAIYSMALNQLKSL